MAKIVQEPMVLQQFLVDGAGGGDLIAETPDRDAGVIIALGDQFPHLAESILPPVCHMHGDIGDLGPDNDAVFIAEIVELLCVLIMGQPQGVGAQLPDDGHVGRMVFIRQGVPPALEILVAAHTAQRIAAPVEEKALFGIAGKDAAAKTARHFVAGGQFCRSRVEPGIVHAVPKAYVFDDELRAALRGFRFAVHGDVHARGVVPGLYGDRRRLLFKIDRRRDFDAGGAVLQKLEVLGRHGDQVDRAVQAAVEGEVCFLGIDIVVAAVVHGDRKRVLFPQLFGQLHAEGRVAALMPAEFFTVEIDLAGMSGAVQLQEQPVSGGLVFGQLADIPANAAMIVVAAVLAVHGVPCVWQGDGLAPRCSRVCLLRGDGVFQKAPTFGQSRNLTHCQSHLRAVFSRNTRSLLRPFCRQCVSAPRPSRACRVCSRAWPAACR